MVLCSCLKRHWFQNSALIHTLNIYLCHLISPIHISWRAKEKIEMVQFFPWKSIALCYCQSINCITVLLIESKLFSNYSCFLKGKVQGRLKNIGVPLKFVELYELWPGKEIPAPFSSTACHQALNLLGIPVGWQNHFI